MDYKEFFLTDNKSGWKTSENKLKKYDIGLYNLIINFCDIIDSLRDLPFRVKVWHFINDIKYIPTCNHCGKDLKFGPSLNSGYGVYCSLSCTNKSSLHIEKVKRTHNERYGGSGFGSDVVGDKIRDVVIDNYGVDNIFKNLQYIKECTIKKHGIEHISKLDSTKEKIRDTNISRYGVSTPILLDDSRSINQVILLNDFNEKYSHLEITNNIGNDIGIVCGECGIEYSIERALLYYRYENNINPCLHCVPKNEMKSIKEKQLSSYIKSLGIDINECDRDIVKSIELDVYIPSHGIGIEFNGLYWHSDLFKDGNFHLSKTIKCEDVGVKLIHIFEDEWVYKTDIVKSRIKNMLGLSDIKIYGRNCDVRVVSTKDKTKFLNDNHIQGAVGSSVNLGLYYKDELVSIMVFGSLRKNMGRKSIDGHYELLRFCNKLDSNVIGGASKLLKYFISNYSPCEIISYADRRWSQGDLYVNLGFEFVKDGSPNYFYVVKGKRINRFNFRKDVLVKEGYDINKSEREIMSNRKIYRIYDCGNKLYKLKLK